MEVLTPAWLDALAEAAANRTAPDPDPLADVEAVFEHVVIDTLAWRITIDHGAVRVEPIDPAGAPQGVRLTSSAATARAIATGEQPALEAFLAGDLRIGGDVRLLIEHQRALALVEGLWPPADG